MNNLRSEKNALHLKILHIFPKMWVNFFFNTKTSLLLTLQTNKKKKGKLDNGMEFID